MFGGEAREHVVERLLRSQRQRQRLCRLPDRDLRHQVGGGRRVDVDSAAAQLERVDRVARRRVGERGRDNDGDHQRQDHAVITSRRTNAPTGPNTRGPTDYCHCGVSINI
jgi:predicted NAD/FAD-binding protein